MGATHHLACRVDERCLDRVHIPADARDADWVPSIRPHHGSANRDQTLVLDAEDVSGNVYEGGCSVEQAHPAGHARFGPMALSGEVGPRPDVRRIWSELDLGVIVPQPFGEGELDRHASLAAEHRVRRLPRVRLPSLRRVPIWTRTCPPPDAVTELVHESAGPINTTETVLFATRVAQRRIRRRPEVIVVRKARGRRRMCLRAAGDRAQTEGDQKEISLKQRCLSARFGAESDKRR